MNCGLLYGPKFAVLAGWRTVGAPYCGAGFREAELVKDDCAYKIKNT